MPLTLARTNDPNVCIFGRLRMWAERGLIHCEDGANGGEYTVCSVRSALHRIDGISEMLRNSRQAMKESGYLYADEYEAHMRMVEQMAEICRRAQAQGMPDDGQARREHVRRRPTTVCAPQIDNIF